MKTPPSLSPSHLLAGALALVLAACGNEPAAAPPPQPTAAPTAVPTPTAAPEPEPAASATPSAKASGTPAAPPKAQSSGRPAVRKSDSSEITDTFGSSPPSVLELGDKELATLRLPENGLHTGTVVTFKIEKSGKTTGPSVGKVYSIKSVIPPAGDPQQIESNGPPFTLELPAGTKKDVNLAIGIEDDKGKIKWTIVAAKSVDESRKVAVFELTTLPSGYLHLTTKAPSGGK